MKTRKTEGFVENKKRYGKKARVKSGHIPSGVQEKEKLYARKGLSGCRNVPPQNSAVEIKKKAQEITG